MKRKAIFYIPLFFLLACQSFKDLPIYTENLTWKSKDIPPTEQNNTGNAEAGFNYLIYGNYIGSGTPYDFIKNKMLKKPDTVLARNGENNNAFYWGNVFTTNNGTKVFAGNCLMCHSGVLNGKVIMGLGNNNNDFTKNQKLGAKILRLMIRSKYKTNSAESEAFKPYGNSIKTVPTYIRTPNRGVNPAFRLEEACMIFRNPVDLTQQKTANFKPIAYTLASDVPPLWNLKKKNALYYNGMGRGSMTKLLMQASVLGIPDSTSARQIHDNFDDVLAWIKNLSPPSFPKEINTEKAERGKKLFDKNCSNCHGNYGEKAKYPNKLVALHIVKTDPLYARYFTEKPYLADWYNKSWFANSFPKSALIPEDGYIAPPLDGIWASAPYLHNGSVPTLENLLNSPKRPILWQKTMEYDYENMGWKVKMPKKPNEGYDATLPGYGNGGHTFGDKLSDTERNDLLEYLKSL